MELEPWMRDTHRELDPLRRGVIHALELAEEDVARWCAGLGEEAMFARPFGLPSVAFHLRHTVRSLDRLLSYAEGRPLNEAQLALLASEMDPGRRAEVLQEWSAGLHRARERVSEFAVGRFGEARGIGRKQLPTTLGGLLVHCAEHTSRHLGQAVTTAKVVSASLAQSAASKGQERPSGQGS